MSLDVYLKIKDFQPKKSSGIFVRENGQTKEITEQEWNEKHPGVDPVKLTDAETNEVYASNITHNLSEMAHHAGVYELLWRPEDLGITKAKDLIEPLKEGLKNLKDHPDFFKNYNPENKWGDYKGLVKFTENYLNACIEYPEAEVEVWR